MDRRQPDHFQEYAHVGALCALRSPRELTGRKLNKVGGQGKRSIELALTDLHLDRFWFGTFVLR